MEQHDSHELALNRAFEERWQRRMERPRSVAALTALQYRERKKYELAWYKNETIQLSEQIEHLQNRLSFLMDQNTSLNLECQKLKKRVAQLENLCRDQLKTLVSRPSKSGNESLIGTDGAQSSSVAAGTVVIADLKVPDDDSADDIDPDEPDESCEAASPEGDARDSSVESKSSSPENKTMTTTTTTVRRGIPVVKQRSPSGKTTIVAAATTSTPLHAGASQVSGRSISYVSLQSNDDNLVQVNQSDQSVGEHDYIPRKRILIPKRAISQVGNEGHKTLRIVRSVGSLSGKSGNKNKSDVKLSSTPSHRSSQIKSPANAEQSMTSKRLSFNSFSKKMVRHTARGNKDISPSKTPEVIISDAESSDIEQHERLSKSHGYRSQTTRAKAVSKTNLQKRSHQYEERPVHSEKRQKSSDNTTAS